METEMVERLYFTVDEMAAIIGVNRSAIIAAIQRKEMPVLRLGKGKNGGIHVRKDAFDQWRLAREQEPPDGE